MKTRWVVIALILISRVAQAGFVIIGNAGNAADGTTGYGAVGYTYQISATEITTAEFTASGVGNGNENYWNDGTRTVGPNAPATYVSVYEAMKYCNWMTSGDINLGAYAFSGGVYQSTDRASAITAYGTVFALPTEDEWYKAAYFKTDASGYSLYANGTDTVPVAGTDANYNQAKEIGTPWSVGSGTAEQNGTYDMMGNVGEWMEDFNGMLRGGTYGSDEIFLRSSGNLRFDPSNERSSTGFRVVAIPEPASAMLVVFGAGVGMAVHRARRLALRR